MNQERMYSVLLAPIVSEKTSMQAELAGQHTFKVEPTATKLEVKTPLKSSLK